MATLYQESRNGGNEGAEGEYQIRPYLSIVFLFQVGRLTAQTTLICEFSVAPRPAATWQVTAIRALRGRTCLAYAAVADCARTSLVEDEVMPDLTINGRMIGY